MKRCKCCFLEYDDKYSMCPHCGYEEGDAQSLSGAIEIGSVLHDRYEIGQADSDQNGFVLYKAWDRKMRRRTVLRTLAQDNADQTAKNRFRHEVRALYECGCKYLFSTSDYFEENGIGYAAQDYENCNQLEKQLKEENKTALEWDRVRTISLQIIEALKVLHRRNTYYCDLSPLNVGITENGTVKLDCFYAAEYKECEKTLASYKDESFIAPEVLNGATADVKSDLYSLAALMYFLITGDKVSVSDERLDLEIHLQQLGIPFDSCSAIINALSLNEKGRTCTLDTFESKITCKPDESAQIGEYSLPEQENSDKIVRNNSEKDLVKYRRNNNSRKYFGIVIAVVSAIALCAVLVVIAAAVLRRFGNETPNSSDEEAKAAEGEEEFEVWYIKPETQSEAANKKTYLEQIVSEAADNVNLKLVSYDADQYKLMLEQREYHGNLPDLYEVCDDISISDTEFTEITEEIAKELNTDEFVSGETLVAYIESTHSIPTGQDLPYLFINKNIARSFSGKADISALRLKEDESSTVICYIDPEFSNSFEYVFGAVTDSAEYVISDQALELFLAGESGYYYGSVSMAEYAAKAFGSSLQVKCLDEDDVTYAGCWKIGSPDLDETDAAAAVLEYLLSKDGQQELYEGETTLNQMPLNQEVFDSALKSKLSVD